MLEPVAARIAFGAYLQNSSRNSSFKKRYPGIIQLLVALKVVTPGVPNEREALNLTACLPRSGVKDTYPSSRPHSIENRLSRIRLDCISLVYSIMIYKFDTLRRIERYRVFVARL